MAVTEDRYPEFDPDKLASGGYKPTDNVYLERFTTTGAFFRIRGPVIEVARFFASIDAQFHGMFCDKVTAAKARSAAKERAFAAGQAKGDIPEDEEFEPIDWDAKNIGVTNKEVYG